MMLDLTSPPDGPGPDLGIRDDHVGLAMCFVENNQNLPNLRSFVLDIYSSSISGALVDKIESRRRVNTSISRNVLLEAATL